MILHLRRYLDEGSDGGAGGDAGTAGQDAANKANAGDAGDANKGAAGAADAGNQDAGKAGDADNKKKPDASSDKKGDDRDAQILSLKEENEKLKTSVGRLGSDIESFKSLKSIFDGDAKQGIAKLAKEFGVQIDFPEGKKVALLDDDGALSESNLDAKFKQFGDELTARFSSMFASKIDAMQEAEYARKYDDWGQLSQDRNSLQLATVSGRMEMAEVLHLAAKGANLPAALDAAKKVGREEYIEELNRKNTGDLKGGSGGAEDNANAKKTGGLDMHNEEDFDHTMRRLKGPKKG